MNTETGTSTISRTAVRLDVAIPYGYDEFLRRFETAVPMWSREQAVEMIQRKAPWSEVVADAAASAPHDFLLYWKLELSALMALAGNTTRATEYLMGNHAIAETMYRHNPAVALYVPLRCAVYESKEGARFTIEQPSAALSDLGHDKIAQVGRDLDGKLANLFTVLDIPLAFQGAA
jgi:hypothetical protein